VRGVDAKGSEFEEGGRILIGADGARSIVRRAMDLGFEGKTYPETTILATTPFRFEDHLPGLSNVNYVWREGGTFSLLRLRDKWRCSLYPDEGESIEQALEPERIERKLQSIVPRDEPYEVVDLRPYRVHMRIVDDYRRGRFVLAGDAAHVNSPSGGMGMNGGVHDAFNLSATLRDIWNGAPLDLLDRYVRQRRPIAADEILTQADANRARMQERNWERRLAMFEELKKVAADPEKARARLLASSMIIGLERSREIA
jgi:3-(3-hydroxy-phenyl)propionate hydroxylase